jgi:hypothetical protein
MENRTNTAQIEVAKTSLQHEPRGKGEDWLLL